MTPPTFDPEDHTHRRYNPLLDTWVLCSPHRAKRPWQGQEEKPAERGLGDYDPKCYLCPRNKRANGEVNPDYKTTFVFENDFAALKPDDVQDAPADQPLLRLEPTKGRCYVLAWDPRHDMTLARMAQTGPDALIPIVLQWKKLYEDISSQRDIAWIQIFENKGSVMGCSNPHPHGQIWALDRMPTDPATELKLMKSYKIGQHPSSSADTPRGQCLLCNYAQIELKDGRRTFAQNSTFIAVVPFWATWPFEALVLPYKRHIGNVADLSEIEVRDLADIYGQVVIRYDNLFECSFPSSMGIHQDPVRSQGTELEGVAHLHLHWYPPLLRSASVRKFLVGFEQMCEPQRDIPPENAASRLKACSAAHYMYSG